MLSKSSLTIKVQVLIEKSANFSKKVLSTYIHCRINYKLYKWQNVKDLVHILNASFSQHSDFHLEKTVVCHISNQPMNKKSGKNHELTTFSLTVMDQIPLRKSIYIILKSILLILGFTGVCAEILAISKTHNYD